MTAPTVDFHQSGDRDVQYKKAGKRRLFVNPDADAARKVFRRKSRRMVDKTTTVKEAVSRLIHDGDYVASGGFGSNRVPVAVMHEIVRQQKRNLCFSGQTSTHILQILVAGKCIRAFDAAYVVGQEARGVSQICRRAFESGEIETTEWTSAALAWRYKAAAMGLSFLPIRSMLGTDTLKQSAAMELDCPFTGKKYAVVPALYPDVALIHVHRSDIYGNCQIEGVGFSDYDLARAAKKLIITSETLIGNEEIRLRPEHTAIPYYLVDAVIEVPFGAYPSNMAYAYFADEEHLQEWLAAEKGEETLLKFLDKNIYRCKNHWDYLLVNGGLERLNQLRQKEHFADRS